MRRRINIQGKIILAAVAAALLAGCGQSKGGETASVQSESVVEGSREESGAGEEASLQGEAGGSGKEADAGDQAAETAKSVGEMYKEIEQSVELVSPVPMGDAFITNYYGIEPEKLEEYVFVMSEEATSAETVIIMKVKDEGDVEAMCSALQVVVDEKRSEMQDYLPEQFEIVDKSSVKSKGNYVYLVISEQADSILQMIEKAI